jgi:hypothetical protein
MTATFMAAEALEMVATGLGEDLELVILDHRIGEEVVADLVKLHLICSIDFDLNRFADADGTNSLEAEVLHGATSGYACWIEDGGFRHDGDDSFHKEWKIGRESTIDKSKRVDEVKSLKSDEEFLKTSLLFPLLKSSLFPHP